MAALRRINQDDLRNHNLSVVIDTLLRTTEPLSRAELAKRTGLTKATMSLLVSMLVDDGVVREGEPSVQSSYGRPSTPLLIAGGRYCGIGLQVNTNGYGVIVLDLDGTVVSERWVDADMSAPDADEVFAELDALAMEQEALLAERGCTVAGAGLALPGLVTGDMRLLMARNLGWEQLDLTRFDVMRRLDVTAGNEANMAALAQIPGYAMRRDGDGIVGPSESFIYLSTDVGIGGAVVRNGHVEIGDHGFGGELGHKFLCQILVQIPESETNLAEAPDRLKLICPNVGRLATDRTDHRRPVFGHVPRFHQVIKIIDDPGPANRTTRGFQSAFMISEDAFFLVCLHTETVRYQVLMIRIGHMARPFRRESPAVAVPTQHAIALFPLDPAFLLQPADHTPRQFFPFRRVDAATLRYQIGCVISHAGSSRHIRAFLSSVRQSATGTTRTGSPSTAANSSTKSSVSSASSPQKAKPI